jgi:hypothetical protein
VAAMDASSPELKAAFTVSLRSRAKTYIFLPEEDKEKDSWISWLQMMVRHTNYHRM